MLSCIRLFVDLLICWLVGWLVGLQQVGIELLLAYSADLRSRPWSETHTQDGFLNPVDPVAASIHEAGYDLMEC
jgi:hypothetical protein